MSGMADASKATAMPLPKCITLQSRANRDNMTTASIQLKPVRTFEMASWGAVLFMG